jgi:hypothetical protein
MAAYSSAWHPETTHVEKVDDLTREKLREWQMRRLEIKDRIQSHPEQTLDVALVAAGNKRAKLEHSVVYSERLVLIANPRPARMNSGVPNSLSSCLIRVVMLDGTQCNCTAAWATLPG